MKEPSIKKNIILNVLRSLMSLLFPLITFPYASRILLPEGIGKVNFANQTISLFSIIASLGINTYALREASKIRDNKLSLNQFCSEILLLNLISTVVSYLCLFTFILLIPKYENYLLIIFISSSTIIFNTIGVDWLYGALEDYEYITFRSFIFQIISLILLFIFVHSKEDYINYAAISVFSSVGSNFCNFIHSRKFITLHFVKICSIKKHLKPVFILFGITIAASVYSILDTNMLGFLSTDTEIGIYSAGIKVVRITIGFLSAINAALLPRLSYYVELKNKEKYSDILYKSINIIEILCIPSTIGLFVLSGPIINIVCGEQYSQSVKVMQIICPIIFFILTGGTLGDQIFTPLRKDKLNLIPVIIGAIINFCLNLILIPKHGAIGAAIGTVFAECSVNIIKMIFAWKYIKGK